jgi:hypothetical protein
MGHNLNTPTVLFCLCYSACLFCSCSACPVLPVTFCLSCSVCPVLPVWAVCPVLWSCSACHVSTCPVLIVLSWLSCHGSLVLPVPFRLSFVFLLSCPLSCLPGVPPVLVCLSCLPILLCLSFFGLPGLSVLF